MVRKREDGMNGERNSELWVILLKRKFEIAALERFSKEIERYLQTDAISPIMEIRFQVYSSKLL